MTSLMEFHRVLSQDGIDAGSYGGLRRGLFGYIHHCALVFKYDSTLTEDLPSFDAQPSYLMREN